MVNLVIYAIPAFLLLLAVEALAYRHATEDHLPGYEARDTATSLSMGIGNVVDQRLLEGDRPRASTSGSTS